MVLGRWSVLCGILICYSLPPTIFLRIPSPEHKLAPIWTRQMNRSNAKPSFSGVLLLRETDDTAHVFMCCIYIYIHICLFGYLFSYFFEQCHVLSFQLGNETNSTIVIQDSIKSDIGPLWKKRQTMDPKTQDCEVCMTPR